MKLRKVFSDEAWSGQRDDWEGGPSRINPYVRVELWFGEVTLLHLAMGPKGGTDGAFREAVGCPIFDIETRFGSGDPMRVEVTEGWNVLHERIMPDAIRIAVASLDQVFDKVHRDALDWEQRRDEVPE